MFQCSSNFYVRRIFQLMLFLVKDVILVTLRSKSFSISVASHTTIEFLFGLFKASSSLCNIQIYFNIKFIILKIRQEFFEFLSPQLNLLDILLIDIQQHKGLICRARSCKRSETLYKSLLFWLAGEVSWLALEVLSSCRK